LAFYSGGTFSSDGTNINHGVVLLSYNLTKGFYTQNSWGTGWGLSGFAWIDPNNNAGICHYAV
jgi:C1A family cysteine protease